MKGAYTLKFQKRMATAILKCGSRKVWLDPTKKVEISQARTSDNKSLNI